MKDNRNSHWDKVIIIIANILKTIYYLLKLLEE